MVKEPLVNRLLKKSLVSARQGKKGRKSAVYTSVNEHFEPFFNTVSRRQRVFQQPVNSVRPEPFDFAQESLVEG